MGSELDADRHLVGEIRWAYEDAADGWTRGPAALYRHLAAALIATSPSPLAGRRILDLGAGTGVASDVLSNEGARPVAIDLAHRMLAHRRQQRPPGVVGDAAALPFPDAAFDAVVGAFSLNHVPHPEVALAQCRRVTRSGGHVLASTFPSDDDHPAKEIVETVLQQFGYRRPDWYSTFKATIADRTGAPGALREVAAAAGLDDVSVVRVEVDIGVDDPDVVVAWRLNMPHTIGFVSGLDPETRTALHARASVALNDRLPPSLPMLALRARVP